jgi:23S rRNA (cytosine1962-C5)-methyltransferase
VSEPDIRLKPGKERPVRFGHPWVFSGAIDGLDPAIAPGTTVTVHAADGTFCGRGYVNPRCVITGRMLTRIDEPIDAAFIARRVATACLLRRALVPPETDAYRVINGEGDFLPGVVADRYGDVVVLQCLTAGADQLKGLLVAALQDVLRPGGIYERSGGSVRREEGLGTHAGVVSGDVPPVVHVRECGLHFSVDVRTGQKTGFFLDQRDNRRLTRTLAAGRSVLNAFAYTGAFAAYAGVGAADQVVSVESSQTALDAAHRNWLANGLPEERGEFVAADVFEYLRATERRFSFLILDPPALVKRRHDVQRGARAYKDLHRWAFRRAADDALVMTFSCSQHVPLDLFRKIVHSAAVEAGRTVQVLRPLAASADHPTSLAHPEGKGIWNREHRTRNTEHGKIRCRCPALSPRCSVAGRLRNAPAGE